MLLLDRENFKLDYYAKDFDILCSGKNLNRLSRLIEGTLDISAIWTEGYGLIINLEKIEVCLFTRKTKIP